MKKINLLILLIIAGIFSEAFAREASLVDRPGAVTDTRVFSDLQAWEDLYLKLYKGDYQLSSDEKEISGSDYSISDEKDKNTFSAADQTKIQQQQEKERAIIAERVRRHPSMKDMTNEDIARICAGDREKTPSDTPQNSDQKTHFTQVQNAQALCEFEKSNLATQKNTSQNNSLTSLFVNATTADSPFDLIVDLNEIDALLFGEKFDDAPAPSFSDIEKSHKRLQRKDYVNYDKNPEKHTEGDTTNYPCEGADKQDPDRYKNQKEGRQNSIENNPSLPKQPHCTQQQSPQNSLSTKDRPETENLPQVQSQYSPTDNSIASHLHNLIPIVHQLNTYSHGAECVATRMFQPPFLNQFLPTSNRLSVKIFRKAPITSGETDAEKSKKEAGAAYFADQEQRILTQNSCQDQVASKNYPSSRSLSQVDKDIDQCLRQRNAEKKSQDNFFQHIQQSEKDDQSFQNIVPVTKQWTQNIQTWAEQIDLLEKIFQRLAQKSSLY